MRMSSGERERLKTKAFKMEVREVKCWSRSDISTYNCSEKHYRHVYCPCSDCNGWATDRSTELRHWCHTNILFDHESDETQLVVVELGTNKFLRLGKIKQWFPMFWGQLPLYFHFPIISVTLPLQWCSRNFPCFRKRSHFFPKIGRNLMLHPHFPRISCFCNIFVFWVSNNIPIISQNTHVFPILSQNGKFKFFPVYASMNSFSVDVFVTQDMTCFGVSFFLIVMCSQLFQVICLPLFGETILS